MRLQGPPALVVLIGPAVVADGADIDEADFGFMQSTATVAQQFPDVKFEHATGYTRLDSLATYDARFYEGRHVAGVIAGRMTESNVIGYIGAYPIPEVIQGINASFLAARSVDPDVQFRIIWANTWFDPALEADAAQTLIEQGADAPSTPSARPPT
jgi:basic membrane protein A and related proteins